MSSCSKCGAKLGRTTQGSLCKKCYLKRNEDSSLDKVAPVGNNELKDSIICDLGLGDDLLNSLPDLPEEWHQKDLHALNAGHLVKILLGFFQPLQKELNLLKSKINEMDEGIQRVNTITAVHSDKFKETEKEIQEKGKEIDLVKKAVFNQQIFLENLQKKQLKNNMIITGIPNSDLLIDDVAHQSDEEKVAGIFNEICDDIRTECYTIFSFPAAENRASHVCKVTFNDFDVKKNVMRNSKKLRDNVSLNKIFLQWDEPKLTRQENQRLRKKKWTLKQDHPNDNFELKKGILKQNDQQVDKFDLINQIF